MSDQERIERAGEKLRIIKLRSSRRLPTEPEMASQMMRVASGMSPDFIARNPLAGRIIPGTGGVRKVRWSRAGLGKRGGARIIYYFHNANRPIYLLTAYAKAKQPDLTPGQKRGIIAIVEEIQAEWAGSAGRRGR